MKKNPTKNFIVTFEVKLHGSIVVQATSAGDARERWLAGPEYEAATAEMTDWNCLGVREEKP